MLIWFSSMVISTFISSPFRFLCPLRHVYSPRRLPVSYLKKSRKLSKQSASFRYSWYRFLLLLIFGGAGLWMATASIPAGVTIKKFRSPKIDFFVPRFFIKPIPANRWHVEKSLLSGFAAKWLRYWFPWPYWSTPSECCKILSSSFSISSHFKFLRPLRQPGSSHAYRTLLKFDPSFFNLAFRVKICAISVSRRKFFSMGNEVNCQHRLLFCSNSLMRRHMF